MANTTADIEQLLTELVRITTNIAALVNATNTNASDGSDSLTSNANRLSLSAAIIAVAAFFIASLQAILEYSSSGESARHKCSVAAIGPFSEYVVKKWSFRHWRWKFYYPVLKPELFATYPWEPPSPARATQTLGWKLALSSPEVDSRPRATWVQLMSSGNALGKRFIMSSIRLDVDSIPGSLDVPPQIIDLVALGKVVVYLGCDSVNISVQNRNFEAVGKFGSITTEELIGFGKVVRFQRYDHVPYHTLIAPYKLWHQHASNLVEGIFNTDAYMVQEQLDNPKSIQYLSKDSPSVFMRDEASHMTSHLKEVLQKEDSNICSDDIYKSVNMISDTNAQAAFTHWQSSLTPVFKNTKFPSILITLAVAVFPCAVNGFPARSLLQPFLIQCRQISQDIYEQCEKPFPDIPNDHNPNRWDFNIHEITRNELRMSVILDASTTSVWTLDVAERVNQHFRAELGFLLLSGRMLKSPLGEGLFRQWRMILAPIADLIKYFDPHSWAQSFRERVQYSKYDTGGDAPLELLTMHVVLVDIQLYHVLSIMHKTYAPQMQFAKHETLKKERGYFWGLLSPRGTFIFHVRAAILKSLSDASLVGSRLFDNFGPALLSEINIPTATTEYEKQARDTKTFY
ncbi:hypothetical protein EV127DRAFT_507762 [Xylaria flabelliformis]|nr:hypothetical protein EV127DRAFT_507762 [Xylaria flabelliformis]